MENPWEWMGQYANSWRSGPDHHDEWKSTAGIIEHNSGLGSYAGPGGWNDWDFIMTGGQVCACLLDTHTCGTSVVFYSFILKFNDKYTHGNQLISNPHCSSVYYLGLLYFVFCDITVAPRVVLTTKI